MENTTNRGISLNSSIATFTNTSTKNQEESYCAPRKCFPVNIAIGIIAVIGIIANIIVIGAILHSKKLRKPIYIGISMLAMPDLIFLTGRLFLSLSKYFNTLDSLTANIISFIILTSYFTSTCHVVLLSLQQYFYLSYPLKSHIWFTVRRMWFVSLIAWAVSAIFAVLYMCVLIIFKEDVPDESRHIFLQALTLLSSLVPVIVLAVLYVLKRIALQKSLVDRRSVPVRRMSRLVGFVVIAYLVCTTPINVFDIMEYSFKFAPKSTLELIFAHLSFILLYCNFTINPFLYFIMTPRFQAICKHGKFKIFSRKRNEQASSQGETGSTLV